jgi:hypothetical protein
MCKKLELGVNESYAIQGAIAIFDTQIYERTLLCLYRQRKLHIKTVQLF